MALIFLWFFFSPCYAQEGSVVSQQFAGLNDTDTPGTLQPSEAQAALNVEANLQGTAALKRHGFTQTATLTVSTSPVSGAYQFIDAAGNVQVIVCQDKNCAHSVNSGNFSNFITTATLPTRWSFVDYDGIMYGVNDKADQPFSYDGTTLVQPFSPSVPSGTLIELTQDRLDISGVSSNPNIVYHSQSGVFTNFTTGPQSSDPWTDTFGGTGDKVTGIKFDRGRLYIFKRQSVTACLPSDQYSTTCWPISNVIGTNSPASIVSTPQAIYFQSQNGSFWQISDSGLNLLSQKISNFVKSQTSQYGANGTGNNSQSGQAAWNAGTQYPLSSWNTITRAGSVLNSSITFNDTFTGDTFTRTYALNNTVLLTSTTYRDQWGSGTTAGTLGWSVTAGAYGIDSTFSENAIKSNGLTGPEVPPANIIKTTQPTLSSGSWKFDYYYTGAAIGGCSKRPTTNNECFEVRFMEDGSSNYYCLYLQDLGQTTTKVVSLIKGIASVRTALTSTQITVGLNTLENFEIQRSTDGRMAVLYNGVQVASTTADTSVTTPTSFEIDAVGGNAGFTFPNQNLIVTNDFANLFIYAYNASGKIISPEYDTTYSTPTWGQFRSTFSISQLQNVEGQVAFYTQVSTSPNNDLYDSKVASSDTLKIASANKRYIQYEADFTTNIATKSPSLSAVTLIAATTGQFFTQCIQPGNNVSSWGALNCATTNLGAGSEVFYATATAYSCSSLPTTPPKWPAGGGTSNWTQTTNNATLSLGTSSTTAVYIGWVSLLGSATDQAQVDACTLNWNNGTVPQPAFGLYDPVKNAVYWDTAINNNPTNNRLLKFDLNLLQLGLNPWFPFDIQSTAMRFINNQVYFGASNGGTWNAYAGSGVDSDSGTAINSYWQSKDFAGIDPYRESSWLRSFVVARNIGSGNLSTSINTSLGSSDAYTISLATTTTLNYVRAGHALQNFSPAALSNIRFSNNAVGVPWEVNAFKLDYFTQPYNFKNP